MQNLFNLVVRNVFDSKLHCSLVSYKSFEEEIFYMDNYATVTFFIWTVAWVSKLLQNIDAELDVLDIYVVVRKIALSFSETEKVS